MTKQPAPLPHPVIAGSAASDSPSESPTPPSSVFEAVGGMPTFERIVSGFYDRVRVDDLIGPMYPEDDWEGAADRLRWFLVQFWGGPALFNENRGHPRLRMRHAPFPIDMAAHDRWLELMGASLAEIDDETIAPAYRHMIWEHMQRVAAMLINRAP